MRPSRLCLAMTVLALGLSHAAVAQTETDDDLLRDFGALARGIHLSVKCNVFSKDLNDEFMSYIVNAKSALDSRGVPQVRQDEVNSAARTEVQATPCSAGTSDEVSKAYLLSQRLTATLYPKGDDPQVTIRFRIKDAYVRWGGAVALDQRCSHLGSDDRAFLTSAYERMAALMPKAQWRPEEIAGFQDMMKAFNKGACGPATETSVREAVQNARIGLR